MRPFIPTLLEHVLLFLLVVGMINEPKRPKPTHSYHSLSTSRKRLMSSGMGNDIVCRFSSDNIDLFVAGYSKTFLLEPLSCEMHQDKSDDRLDEDGKWI